MLILITTIHFIELPEHAYNTLTYKLCFLCHQTIFIYYTVLNISNPKTVAQSPKININNLFIFKEKVCKIMPFLGLWGNTSFLVYCDSFIKNIIFDLIFKYRFIGKLFEFSLGI